MTTTPTTTCPAWCHERDDAGHAERGWDHYDAPWRHTAATAGHPILLDGGVEFSLASVAVYQADGASRPLVDLDVSQINGGAVEERCSAALHLRPEEAVKLGQDLIAAAAVLGVQS